jgi:hypothetical protein
VDLKPVLGEIKADSGNLHNGWLLSLVAFSDDHTLAHRCRGAGAIHPIKTHTKQACPAGLERLDINGSKPAGANDWSQSFRVVCILNAARAYHSKAAIPPQDHPSM